MLIFQFHLPILQRFLQEYSWQFSSYLMSINWSLQTNEHFNILKKEVKNSLKLSWEIFSNRLGHFISKFKLYGYMSIYRFWQQKTHSTENHFQISIFKMFTSKGLLMDYLNVTFTLKEQLRFLKRYLLYRHC